MRIQSFFRLINYAEALKILRLAQGWHRPVGYSSRNHKFHLDCSSRVKSSPTLLLKYNDDDDEEKIQYVLVKAPPGAADTTVPGRLEWEKTVGARVKVGEVVCRIRFKDGRILDIPAPSKGVIAIRKKNEGEPVQHSEELFKIRVDPANRQAFLKKKLKKTRPFDLDEDEAESSLLAQTEHLKPPLKSSYISSEYETAKYKKDSSFPTMEPLGTQIQEGLKGQHQHLTLEHAPELHIPSGHSGSQIQKAFQPPLYGLSASLMTNMEEINMEGTMKFYEKQNKDLYPIRPSFRTFYIKAAAFALMMNPPVNIKILNNEVIQKSSVDVTIGFKYLKVMVFHTFTEANKIPYMEITRILQGIKKKVAEGSYRAEKRNFEFTISQEWERGSVFGTPNYSKTCTLGLHKTLKRPILEENKIVAPPMMYVSLTYDKHVIAEEDAIKFLKMYKLALEEPRYILINTI